MQTPCPKQVEALAKSIAYRATYAGELIATGVARELLSGEREAYTLSIPEIRAELPHGIEAWYAWTSRSAVEARLTQRVIDTNNLG